MVRPTIPPPTTKKSVAGELDNFLAVNGGYPGRSMVRENVPRESHGGYSQVAGIAKTNALSRVGLT
jgi:hypothetical protein